MKRWKIQDILIPIINERDYKFIAEIGVDRGGLTTHILKNTSVREYWAIDPWKEYIGEGSGKLGGVSQEEWDRRADAVLKLLAIFPQLRVLREESVTASKKFKPASFDMVFIDAIHSYKHTKQDIIAWEPLVRPGGVLCGHDYTRRFKGTIKAVDELIGDDLILFEAAIWLKEICD